MSASPFSGRSLRTVWDLIYALLKQPYTYLGVAILLVSTWFILAHNNLNSRDKLIQFLLDYQINQQAKPNFASFSDGNLTTDEGSPFNTCTDAQYEGESKVEQHVIFDKVTNDNYLKINFDLKRGHTWTMNTYVCVFAYFSTPPTNFDISQYEGISFKSRLKVNRGSSDNIKPIISIVTPEDRKCYISHESNYFTKDIIGEKLYPIVVPFTKLIKPDYMRVGELPPFNKKAAYQVVFSVRGEDQAGSLDITDIKFYTSSQSN